jgi:ATP-binding cassette, subfamily B, bacterial PglK
MTISKIISYLYRLWHHFSLRRRRDYYLLMTLTIFSSVLEIVSLSAVIPFLGVITNPEEVIKYPLIADITSSIGIQESSDFIAVICIGFIIVALLAGGVRTLLVWVSTRIIFVTGRDLSEKVFTRTLYQPYSVHLDRSSSEIISGLTQKMSAATSVITAAVTLIISMMLFLAIMTTLFVINYVVALTSVVIFGSTYLFMGWLTKNRVALNGQRIASQQVKMVKTTQESLGGIRDILLDESQEVYCKEYYSSINLIQRADSENVFMNRAPRYIMETLGLVLIASIVLIMNYQTGDTLIALPILGVLALAAQRSLPLMQQIYASWTSMLSSEAALLDVFELLDQSLPEYTHLPLPERLVLKKSIHLDNISFRYGRNSSWVFENINLKIPKGSRVGIIGITGSGKSTVVDLIMGLLKPTHGKILVDGKPISRDETRRSWQRAVAHVPQSIFLVDSSIGENIAFGVKRDKIDFDRVRRAAEQAQIAEFIESRPKAYNEIVGERGVRLSGGQRQRIGIARALYKQASVLIFDEATSSLDNETEQSIIQTIENLGKDLTIIMIAHRLTSLSSCSIIIELSNESIKKVGSYKDMMNKLV